MTIIRKKMSVTDQQESEKYFTVGGKCKDEIRLVFDDGNILYASENFLTYVSPVFQAMFSQTFTEKLTGEVKLPGKNYGHFLEFLLTLHPAVQKTIDRGNVFDIVAIANEYQMSVMVSRCKAVMTKLLQSEYAYVRQSSYFINSKMRKCVSLCLIILHTSIQCQFEDVTKRAIKTLGKFGYGVFIGDKWSHQSDGDSEDEEVSVEECCIEKAPVNECYDLFSELPDDIKIQLLAERLKNCDRNETL